MTPDLNPRVDNNTEPNLPTGTTTNEQVSQHPSDQLMSENSMPGVSDAQRLAETDKVRAMCDRALADYMKSLSALGSEATSSLISDPNDPNKIGREMLKAISTDKTTRLEGIRINKEISELIGPDLEMKGEVAALEASNRFEKIIERARKENPQVILKTYSNLLDQQVQKMNFLARPLGKIIASFTMSLLKANPQTAANLLVKQINQQPIEELKLIGKAIIAREIALELEKTEN